MSTPEAVAPAEDDACAVSPERYQVPTKKSDERAADQQEEEVEGAAAPAIPEAGTGPSQHKDEPGAAGVTTGNLLKRKRPNKAGDGNASRKEEKASPKKQEETPEADKRRRPRIKSAADDAAVSPSTPKDDSGGPWFCVQKHLHLGLGLRIGRVYAASDLRHRARGDKSKLSKLAKAMSDPTFFTKADPPESSSLKSPSSRKRSARSKTPSRPPKKQRPKFLSNQVVLDRSATPVRVAKIVDYDPEHAEAPFRLRFLDETGRLEGDAGEVQRPASVITPVDLDHIQPHSFGHTQPHQAGLSSEAEAARGFEGRPASRPAFVGQVATGTVVWVTEQDRPAWPGRVLAGGQGPVRVQLLGAESCELVPLDRLLPFMQGDASCLALVAALAEALHKLQGAQEAARINERLSSQNVGEAASGVVAKPGGEDQADATAAASPPAEEKGAV